MDTQTSWSAPMALPSHKGDESRPWRTLQRAASTLVSTPARRREPSGASAQVPMRLSTLPGARSAHLRVRGPANPGCSPPRASLRSRGPGEGAVLAGVLANFI
jgi:hypothetical protein